MLNDTGPDHVHINANHASNQMIVCGHSGRMIPVLPERLCTIETGIM